MKPRLSQKNNLSLQLVTFVAAVSSIVLHSAIAVGAADGQQLSNDLVISKSINLKSPLVKQQQLIAQVWSDLKSEELSLGTIPQTAPNLDTSTSNGVDPLLVKQLDNQQQQLIAQVWSDLKSDELSLGTIPQTAPSLDSSNDVNPLLVKQLNDQQQQLIAQVWSDLKSEELSLGTIPQTAPSLDTSPVNPLLVKQLNNQQQQLIAQVWSDLKSEELSLGTIPQTAPSLDTSPVNPLLVKQLNDQQQQLIAQVWSDLETEELSLGTIPQTAPSLDSSNDVDPLLVKQLNNQQQQLIAQVWSDLKSEELSLGTIPQTAPSLDSSNDVDPLLVKQLNNQQQQLIAQVWSDLKSEELSLGTIPQTAPSLDTSPVNPLLVKQLNDQQQQLIAQVWSDLKSEELSLATSPKTPAGLDTSAKANPLLVKQLNDQQQQLIAQVWSDLESEELSLATSPQNPAGLDTSAKVNLLLVKQLNDQQQQFIAQVWSDLKSDELSLGTIPQTAPSLDTSPVNPLLVKQLDDQQQQLIAQVWSDLESEELSLATSPENLPNNNTANTVNPLLVTQLNNQQQQLIAQVWSDLESEELSLATSPQNPAGLDTSAKVNPLLVKQLNDQQQQFIAQVWSDLKSEELSLANDLENTSSLIVTKNADNPQELSINELNNQQVVAQNWSNFEGELSFAEPNTDLKLTPAVIENIQPSQPATEPIINPHNKREIAARLALQKVQIIAPAPGVILSEEHNDSVTIQYPVETAVKLEVNGTQLDDSLITQQQLDSKRNLITQTWKGADLRNGENTLDIIAQKDGFSSKTSREVLVQNSTTLQNAVQPETANNSESTAPQSPTNQSTPTKPQSPSQPESQSVKILSPTANAILDRIHSSVIIQYPQGASVVLQVNGKSVDAGQVGHTTVNPVSKIVTQTWYGVIFSTGVNTLSVLSTTDRVNYSKTSIQVTVPGKPVAIALEAVEAEVPADGKSVATIKGRYIDQHGTTTPWNEVITLQSNAGQFLGNDLDPDTPGFQLKPANGEFTASLQAGYNAKQVRILATSSNLESYTQTKFKTTLREKPLLTGFADFRLGARGTNFYDSYRDFLPLDEDNDVELDVTAAGFIQGSWGRWSYTGAFHSDRPINEDPDGESRLFQTYSPSEYDYPIYGDDSSVEATTPSIDNVYFRLEQNPIVEFANPNYFMWGDYDTQEFATEAQEFSAISRQLHGFKFNYNLGNLQLNGLYANNVEGFQRDSISPDGTSGFYFLSRRLLVPGSEDVYIELTPLNNPGNVVFRQRLNLGTDYEIDYERGTLLFSDPVLNTEIDGNGDILVRRIVATYQFESEAMDSNIFAGRGQYYFDRNPDTPSWLGTSYLTEDRGDQDFSLWSIDSYISLGTWGSLSGEYASSSNETVFAKADGSAYHLEGDVKFSKNFNAYAYYSKADEGFTNNATLSFIPGQIRYGTLLNAQIGDSTNLRFSYEHQDNEGIAPRPLDELEEFLDSTTAPVPGDALDNTLDSITAGVEQKIGSADLGLDLIWRNRTDNKSPEALDSTSTQLRSQFSIPITSTLDFHALNDLTLSDDTDSVFSDRIGFGLDWEFYSGLSLVVSQQWFTRGNLAGEALTTIGLTGEYEPWHNGKITGRYNVSNGEGGMRNLGSFGIHQKIAIAPGLQVNLDYENAFDGFENTGSGQQFAQPFTVGQSASALGFGSGSTYSVGIKYNDSSSFTADAQWQHSDRSEGGNTVWSAGITGKLTNSLTSLLSFNQASSANQVFDIGTTRRLRLGLAYRNPDNDVFNALLRYEYEEDGATIPETLLIGKGSGTQEHLFGIETIYAPHWRWEFYSKYAFRNSKTFLADDFIASSNVSLGQLRATYRLNYHFDLVTEGRMIWQPSAGFTESGFIVEAGYYATPELRLSAGYVFGSADDEDFTGTRSAGGPYLGVTVKLNGLLDGFGQNRPPELPEGVAQQELQESEEIGKVGSMGH